MKLPPFWSSQFCYGNSWPPSMKIYYFKHKNIQYSMWVDDNLSTELQFGLPDHIASWMPDILKIGAFK